MSEHEGKGEERGVLLMVMASPPSLRFGGVAGKREGDRRSSLDPRWPRGSGKGVWGRGDRFMNMQNASRMLPSFCSAVQTSV